MVSMDELLKRTMRFFLEGVASELNRDIDWRATGHDRGVLKKVGIYAAAMVRDLIRIPLHHRGGIAQARFRVRVGYISEFAIPTLRFFVTEYPLDERTTTLLEEAVKELQQGVDLIADGPMPTLDEWYATMEEFHRLTEHSKRGAEKITRAVELTAHPVP